jgi:hypothetical protein
MPKPRKKNYCHVCEIKFEDYRQVKFITIQHSCSEYHQKSIKKDPYHRKIKKICKKFNKNLYFNIKE